MTEEKRDTAFQNAVDFINSYTDPLPADFLLRLYAYYKRATNNVHSPGSSNPLINAFKTNALFQTRGISPEDAKEKYIESVNEYFNQDF